MTTARALIMPPDEPGTFHCVSRCVRRAWLCGVDPYSKRSFEHRRQWVEDRLLALAEIFAVGIHSYAVMSNHVHLVVHIEPDLESGQTQLRIFLHHNAANAYTTPGRVPTDSLVTVRHAVPMTTARALIMPPDEPGTFHCVSRCVRRAWLCGVDPYSKRSFEHRRQWVEDRLLALAEIFAVGIHSYAVMSNHVHLVVHVEPALTASWSDREVAERAVALHCPAHFSDKMKQSRVSSWKDDPDRVAWFRKKLGMLSYFMQALNQFIAKAANAEDSCTGKFWEGRFKCQRLEDESAVLSVMTYVDLNPIRAKLAADLPSSPEFDTYSTYVPDLIQPQ